MTEKELRTIFDNAADLTDGNQIGLSFSRFKLVIHECFVAKGFCYICGQKRFEAGDGFCTKCEMNRKK